MTALRAPRVRRQNGRAEPNPLTTDSLPVAQAWLAHGHRSDAGHDLALGQMPVTHDALVARPGIEIRISPQEVSDLRLDRLREQGTRSVAQNLSERIGDPHDSSEHGEAIVERVIEAAGMVLRQLKANQQPR
jgi:hypothetical protein